MVEGGGFGATAGFVLAGVLVTGLDMEELPIALLGRGGCSNLAAAAFADEVGAGVFDLGGSPFGVLDRGGGALTSSASSSSRYGSPCTRKGRP